LGDFIETKVKKSPTSPGLVSPDVMTEEAITRETKAKIVTTLTQHFYTFSMTT
jgi:hypothetical protein